jgi:hypothetical protein
MWRTTSQKFVQVLIDSRKDNGAAKSSANQISFSVTDVADATVAVTEKSKFRMP